MNSRPAYKPNDLLPRRIAPFGASGYHVRSGYAPTDLPRQFDIHENIAPQAVASIRKAFLLAKTSHEAWKTGRREGKVDVRQAMRVKPVGGLNVFRSRAARSATKIKCYVVLDDSGSMNNNDARIPHPLDPKRKVRVQRFMASAVFGATVVEALGSIPTVSLDVFSHSCRSSVQLTLKWVWHKGTPLSVFNRQAEGRWAPGGGNADGHALYALSNRMLKELRHGEKGIVFMVSDGQPADSPDGRAQGALVDAVKFARGRGLTVIGISIDNSEQRAYYGDDTIQFDGDWTHLGGEIARLIGRAVAA